LHNVELESVPTGHYSILPNKEWIIAMMGSSKKED